MWLFAMYKYFQNNKWIDMSFLKAWNHLDFINSTHNNELYAGD